MRKIIKRVSLLICFAILFTICPNNYMIDAKVNRNIGGELLENLVKKEENIRKECKNNSQSKMIEKYNNIQDIMELDEDIYESGYSGAYIYNNDEIVVLVNEENAEKIAIEKEDDIIIEYCEYSLNDLQEKYNEMKILFDKWENYIVLICCHMRKWLFF